jgi:hypothetical protein
MPCNSDYLEATSLERELSKVACLLDEIAGKPCERRYAFGYHPRVYGKATRELGDQLVGELCNALQGADVSQFSLDMQIWWRDHQAADEERIQKETAIATLTFQRETALSKLTAHEQWLLGLRPSPSAVNRQANS